MSPSELIYCNTRKYIYPPFIRKLNDRKTFEFFLLFPNHIKVFYAFESLPDRSNEIEICNLGKLSSLLEQNLDH